MLLATATLCLAAALLLDSRQVRPLLVAGIGYLPIDERFAIHESVGHNLGFLADLRGAKRPDDVVLAAYGIPAVLFLVHFWPLLGSSVLATRLLVATLVLFAAGAPWDAAGLPAEELFELAPSLSLLAAFIFLTLDFAGWQKAAT